MKSFRWFSAGIVIGVAGCVRFEPPITPPESTHTRVRAPVVVDGASEMADVAQVSPEFFKADGLQPILGRFFTVEDFRPGTVGVAVLSHAYWTDRFKAQPAVIGTKIVVDGKEAVVVGVGPPRLQPPQPVSVLIPR
jgi:MacB-like periplasmic core domain